MSTDGFDLTTDGTSSTPGRRKNNFAASAAPAVTDDTDSDYEVGSIWVDTTADTSYICVDSSSGAAVWVQTQGGTGDGTSSLHTDASVTGAHDVDLDDGATHDLTLTGNATFTFSGVSTGDANDLWIVLRQDATGSRTVTWPGSVTWLEGEPTLQTAASAVDVLGFFTVDDGSTWYGSVHAGADRLLAGGSADEVLVPDANEPTGLRWGSFPELVMEDGVTNPPVPVENEAQDDWIYTDP